MSTDARREAAAILGRAGGKSTASRRTKRARSEAAATAAAGRWAGHVMDARGLARKAKREAAKTPRKKPGSRTA